MSSRLNDVTDRETEPLACTLRRITCRITCAIL